MSREPFMARGVRRLGQIAATLQSLLSEWDRLPDAAKRVRIYDVLQDVNNARALAENWRLLAEANGLKLPGEDEIDGET